jgi:two-component system sensor kinase FixL
MNLARYARDTAVFAPCFVVLDWASYIDPVGPFNITPWNPQAALAVVWLLLGGLAHAPVVLATVMLAEIVVRQAPGGIAVTLLTALVLAGGYTGIAYAMKRLLKDAGLRTARELAIFCGVSIVGTGVIGAAFLGVLDAAGHLAQVPWGNAWMRFWVGDAVGLLVTAPLLLAVADDARRPSLVAMLRKPEVLLQLAVIAATLYFIFRGPSADPARHFYLMFLPLIWIAVRATAFVQIGVVLGIHAEVALSLSIVELQALVAALTLTGLFLGVMVDERQRAEEGLRQTLRLAAAGEMAGAITHEVNQPLTALANYGRSAQMLAATGPEALPQVQEIVARMLSEAERAAEVVRRLRDFFRTGTTRLERVEMAEILDSARRIGGKLIGPAAIELEITPRGPLPPLYVDRLQIELVLRNLLANAVESLSAIQRDGARIEVQAHHEKAGIIISILDNGPGVKHSATAEVFEPFVSGKPTGMGLGLAVSRAIAEAHGGSLDVVPGGHGEFRLALPCAPA